MRSRGRTVGGYGASLALAWLVFVATLLLADPLNMAGGGRSPFESVMRPFQDDPVGGAMALLASVLWGVPFVLIGRLAALGLGRGAVTMAAVAGGTAAAGAWVLAVWIRSWAGV